MVAVQMKSSSQQRRGPVQVVRQPTPVYTEPTREKRMRTVALLGGGSVVAGALIAFFLSVAIALAIGTVTSLLK